MPGPDTSSVISQGTTGSGRSIFPKGPSFTIENFSSKDFIVRDFIESLTETAIPVNRRSEASTQAFDPKPFIRAFEQALSRLSSLSEDLDLKETELINGVRRAEAQHTRTLDSLGKKLDQTINNFQNLDVSFNGPTDGLEVSEGNERGGNTAVKIGERLEDLDKQRRRALDAKFLVQCWLEISERGESLALEEVRRHGGGEGKLRSAVLARHLMKISQRLDPESWSATNGKSPSVNGYHEVKGRSKKHNTREIIEKFSEILEKDLLKQFDEFYRRQNFEGMRECANVLYDFNGGANVTALFVNQHQFFIDRNQLVVEDLDGDADMWEKLADPDAEPPGVEPSLQSLIDEVKIVVQDESFIIKRAFPYHELVLGKFLQRIFQQSIQQRLEMVLDKAHTVSSLALLRSLQSSRNYMSSLVDDLKTHGLTENPEPMSSQTSMTLDQQLDDLLGPYLLSSSYIEREKRSLGELYASLLFKFTVYHSRRKKLPTTFMASLAKSGSELLASAKDAYIDRLDSSDLSHAQKSMLLRVSGLKEADSIKNKNDIDVTEQDGTLSVTNAKRMLKWMAEGVGRGLELSGGSETPKEVFALLKLLLDTMGTIYLETALDAAADYAASQENSKNEPDLSYLPNVRSGIAVIHLMLTFIHTVLIPLAASNLTVRREMEKTTIQALNRFEDKTNLIMQRTIDVVVAWTGKLLLSQKRSDFRSREGIDVEMLQTPTCSSITTFLSKLNSLLLITLPHQNGSMPTPAPSSSSLTSPNPQTQSASASPNPNLVTLSTELALSIRATLLEHFKKFSVNATGALMVAKDMTAYSSALKKFPLSEAFLGAGGLDALAEVGNLYVVGVEALSERLKATTASARAGESGESSIAGGKSPVLGIAGLDRADIKAFVLKREDAGSIGVQTLVASL